MPISPVTSSVQATGATTYTVNTKHTAGDTLSSAVAIGNLAQEGVILSVSDQGSEDGTQVYNFTLDPYENTYLQLSFGNVVDKLTTHIQLLDSNDNVIADNLGDATQQYAFDQLITTGLAPGSGNYRLEVTPVGGEGSPQIALTALPQQGTSLAVNSTLTAGDPEEFYSFSLGNSSNLKLNFDANGKNSALRIQLYDSTGHLIADNRGTLFQQNNYTQLTSGTGFTGTSGDYVVKVSYANQTGAKPDIKYNFQLYSGTTYAVTYKTNVAPSVADNSASASVKPTDDAKVFGRQAFHTIGETAQSAVGIGWIMQNKTSLDVTSRLTGVDNTEFYSFVLQAGNNLKLGVSNLTNKADTTSLRLQLLDSSGGRVLADNQGTSAQRDAFDKLTSSAGLESKTGTYVIKAIYGQGAVKSQDLTYNFKIYSGTSYSSVYRTTASPQTYQSAILSGSISGGYSPFAASASYLNSLSQGTEIDIISALTTSA
ncbi:MAG: hypothetical protein WAO98_04790 [Alphaproteobacteria bacterium]